ncbi:alpha/beta hydrolase-fold protein [Roseisolibacter sp. H3M3-2]|uniref:alpha/beta hydrolase n=1 Tax=Roseisolibacter sp. H3M3-2 TaxID=3031323 RepID=UPI0023DC8674|nr:alpha/beta hydrolase-fold protein [Roseisolibacter sp. H3M3-2]MDF1505417.1 alpha/beta hydrolase-fold protein [Roseisolibacter sp. H3M3-2]
MTFRVRAALLALLLAAAAPATAQEITLPQTRTHVLRSAVNGEDYHLAVALPMGYRAADTTRYPVLYVLDGGAHLPLLASMFRLTNRGGRGDVLLVGVGYYPPGAFPRAVPGQTPRRNVDYSPPRPAGARDTAPLPWPARAPDFHRILKEEILPFVERTYRTTGDRALHGHSLGGLFATYVLFEDPDLFARYAIVSPSYWWDGGSAFAREAAFRATRTSLPKQVFLGVGGLEGPDQVAGMWRMTAALCAGRRAGAYAGLTITAEVIPDEHHGSATLFGRPLRAFYPPYATDGARADPCVSR